MTITSRRKSRPKSCSQILVIIGLISLLTTLFFATLLPAIPVQIAFAQQSQPPFVESGRPPIEGWKLAGPGQNSREVSSSEGDVVVSVIWTPAQIGQPSKFSLHFADIDGNTIFPIYDIELLRGNKTVPGSLRQDETSLVQEYIFNETGVYMLRIRDIQDRPTTDVINIPLQVT